MNLDLRAGIIAAGEGLRLKEAFPGSPKPMIPIKGVPLVGWTVSSLQDAGVRQITVLFNSRGIPAKNYLKTTFKNIQWTFLMKDTRSSWESFNLVSRIMAQQAGPFLISTVDMLANPSDISLFARSSFKAFGSTTSDRPELSLALTRFVEDEKPLWTDLSPEGFVTAVGPAAKTRDWATAGLYALAPTAVSSMPSGNAHDSLRGFWAEAAEEPRMVLGVPLSKTIDMDRPEDLAAAESFLSAREIPAC